jgi:hypothetical protein
LQHIGLVIGLVIGTIIVVVGLLLWGFTVYSNPSASADSVAICRAKIIEYQDLGYYSTPENYRLVESYCQF